MQLFNINILPAVCSRKGQGAAEPATSQRKAREAANKTVIMPGISAGPRDLPDTLGQAPTVMNILKAISRWLHAIEDFVPTIADVSEAPDIINTLFGTSSWLRA